MPLKHFLMTDITLGSLSAPGRHKDAVTDSSSHKRDGPWDIDADYAVASSSGRSAPQAGESTPYRRSGDVHGRKHGHHKDFCEGMQNVWGHTRTPAMQTLDCIRQVKDSIARDIDQQASLSRSGFSILVAMTAVFVLAALFLVLAMCCASTSPGTIEQQ